MTKTAVRVDYFSMEERLRAKLERVKARQVELEEERLELLSQLGDLRQEVSEAQQSGAFYGGR